MRAVQKKTDDISGRKEKYKQTTDTKFPFKELDKIY